MGVARPIAGTYLTVDHCWRWTTWATLIIGGSCSVLSLFAIPESSAEVLLQKKACSLRKQTGNASFRAKREMQPVTADVLVTQLPDEAKAMLVREPTLLVMTIYSSLVYGILYLLFLAMPYTYISTRDWSAKKSSLPFLAVLIGIFLCCLATALTDITWRVRRFLARHRTILPEDRLPQLMVSTIILPQGLFWFAWTSKRSVPWTAQVCSGVLIGAVISLNLLSTTAYLIDVYMLHSKGAVAVYLCMRSFLGAMFPLFALQMFEDFGVEWAATVLALLCVGLSPMSFLFWRYGKTIRGWSRYVFET